jgi:hypothetical protein
LILEGQGQARSHLKFNVPWSHEWGPVQFLTRLFHELLDEARRDCAYAARRGAAVSLTAQTGHSGDGGTRDWWKTIYIIKINKLY